MAFRFGIKEDLFKQPTERYNEIIAVIFFALAVFIFMSLITFDYDDLPFFSSITNTPVKNFAGIVGAYIGCGFLMIMGTSSFGIPVLLSFWAVARIAGVKPEKYSIRFFGTLFLILAISSTLSLLSGPELALRFRMGGIVGVSFSSFLTRYLGVIGATVVIVVLLLLSVLIATNFLIFPIIVSVVKLFINQGKRWLSMLKHIKPVERKPLTVYKIPKNVQPAGVRVTPVKKTKPDVGVSQDLTEQPRQEKQALKEVPISREKVPAKDKANEVKPLPRVEMRPEYNIPTLDLLSPPPPVEQREIKDDLTENSKILEEILNDFDIEAKVIEANRGPVITRYELAPGTGVKIHRITSLSDNIALAMKAQSIRIVAPVPGKGTVGIEVPNSKSVMVYEKEVLESEEYRDEESLLKLALGKDIAGEPVIADLATMPHLLIAGATGSGKTVCVNSIITSLLFNATPEQIRFIMVDPKKVELASFNNLPHLLCPVVTDYKKVPVALDWLVGEMERRFDLFATCGVRNIDFYNQKAEDEKWEPLYYIVVIIDELADLMMVLQQEIEGAIIRLAQLSRAVGVHMILATQRPSVNVITGVIKANFSARISFKVASKVDSRTVLDMNGAEKLLGRGDMLFVEPGTEKPIRAQGSLVLDEEIENLAEFIKAQRDPDYQEAIVKTPKKSRGKRFQKDEIYEEAVRIVAQTKQASVSLLQRKLGVGYTKAARIIDMMEDEGIVGPYQGSKPREVLIDNVEEYANE